MSKQFSENAERLNQSLLATCKELSTKLTGKYNRSNWLALLGILAQQV